MTVRKSRLALAAVAGFGAAAGLVLHRNRRKRAAVTLYSGRGYTGERRRLDGEPDVWPTEVGLGLPRIGSVRVHRVRFTFRRASVGPTFLRAALFDRNPEDRALARAYLPLALLRMTDPRTWFSERDPAGDRSGWVRLWHEPPPGPSGPGETPAALFIAEDCPDTGEWSTAAFVEVGTHR